MWHEIMQQATETESVSGWSQALRSASYKHFSKKWWNMEFKTDPRIITVLNFKKQTSGLSKQ